ncbi:MAG: diguanylate cyclase [Dehalococcoidia bacterium]
MTSAIGPDVLIPLIAVVVYVPLFVILLTNRPWDRRQKLFFAFLATAAVWSFTTFLSRSDLLGLDKIVEVRIAISIFVLMLVQFHFFIASFYSSAPMRVPWPYAFPIVTIVLAAFDRIPASVQPINYGTWVVGMIVLFLVIVGLRDVSALARRRSVLSDPEERNQITYLMFAIGAITASLIINILPWATQYPVSHVGNLVVAVTLTYAVVAHRLLDVRVIFRSALINLLLYGTGIGIVLLVFSLVSSRGLVSDTDRSLLVALVLGIPAVLLFANKVGAPWRTRMERAFIGERYAHRRRLSQFVATIHDVQDMEQFGKEFVGLLSESIYCRRSCVLLPRGDDGFFVARFSYPPVEHNPMAVLQLRPDSPILKWLRQEQTILPERNLSILPEFQSMWQDEKDSVRSAEIEIFIPVVNRDEIAAILAVSGRRDGKLYTVEDMHLLESMTTQVAASLEKEYYNEQLQEQDREITLLNRLATIVTSSMSMDLIFESFVSELRNMLDFDWATVSLVEDDELHILALSSNIDSPWKSDGRIPLAGTATEHVCREKKKVYEPDLVGHQMFVTGKHHIGQGVRSIVYLPLQIKDECIGSFIVASRERDAFSAKQIRLLEQVALQIATPIENSQLYAKAEQRARVDELTGLFNRRHFEERMKEELSRHGRHGTAFSVFILDLDGFKTYNDIYGHPSGDVLLAQVAKMIKGSIRNADQAFRYGGDEFIVILPDTNVNDAHVVAERVRKTLADEMKRKEVAVTCSIGLAGYPSDGVISGELVTVADTALYFAKRTGGNRVYLSSNVLSEPVNDSGTYARHNGLSAIYALVSAVEAKDPCTYGHSRRVNTYAVLLAEASGLPPEQVSRVSTAALLHDIGKIGVPDRVLNKKGKLNAEEWELIKTHPRLGATIVGNVPNLIPCVSTILHHHEKWDGSGYPEGLKGEAISLEARILAVADAYEAMSSERPYRPAIDAEKVLAEMRRCAGSQFDPSLIDVFIGIIEQGLPDRLKATEQAAASKPGS